MIQENSMPKKRYPLEPGGAQDLELEWEGAFNNFAVRFRGQEAARFATSKEILAGVDVTLDDQNTVHIRLVPGLLSKELHILKDGVPLPGTPGSLSSKTTEASITLILVSVLNVGLGLLAQFSGWSQLFRSGLGWGSTIFGGVLGLLALFAYFKHGWAFLVSALVLLVDSVWGYYQVFLLAATPNIGSILIRLMIIYTLWKGWQASQQQVSGSPEKS